MKMVDINFILVMFLHILTQIQCLYQSLDSDSWTLFNDNESIVASATVPGGIYSDLIKNKLLGHPFYGENDVKYRWVGETNWNYVRQFSVDSTYFQYEIFLMIDGIDTVSQVYLNDNLIGTTQNMFVCYQFDIKKYLNTQINILKVRIISPIHFGLTKHQIQIKNYPIPPLCPHSIIYGSCHINYIRKMQASFGWDWGPSFPSSGIWKPIGIQFVDRPILKEIMAWTFKTQDHWSINVTIIFHYLNQDSSKIFLRCFLDKSLIFDQQIHINSFDHSSYKYNFVHQIDPQFFIQLWWPNGVGMHLENGFKNLGQKLYKLKCAASFLFSPDIKSTKTKSIGFRTIKLVQSPIMNKAESFYFEVNGFPIFAKGSNWIPSMILPELQDKNYIKFLLLSVKNANMNMLRVWGGGVYESDYFYELADEYGILIWQDFMFAVALYPTDKDFLNSVTVEVTQQIERLQSHPCIAIWSANNENEIAIANKWWPEIFKYDNVYRQDYIKLYIDTIKKIVTSKDPFTPFVASSPSNGIETIKQGWISDNPADNRYGDTHYYNYFSDSWDWKQYPSAKFVSEYGFQSYPSLRCLQSVIPFDQLVYPLSPMLKHRQHHEFADFQIENQILSKLKIPKPGSIKSLNHFIYLSQISQAVAMKIQTEFYRRNREIDFYTGLGMTMGALYWQLNDVWQAPSWSSIEFGGNWKMLHYYANKFFSPVLVSPFTDEQDLCVSVINDGMNSINLQISIFIYELNSFNPTLVSRSNLLVNKSSSQLIFKRPFYQILQPHQCSNIDNCIIRVVYDNSKANFFGDNFLILGKPKNAYKLAKANIKLINITALSNSVLEFRTFELVIQTDAPAMFVWIEFILNSKIRGHFSDNGFMLFSPYKSLAFQAETKTDINEISKDIVFLTLSDTFYS